MKIVCYCWFGTWLPSVKPTDTGQLHFRTIYCTIVTVCSHIVCSQHCCVCWVSLFFFLTKKLNINRNLNQLAWSKTDASERASPAGGRKNRQQKKSKCSKWIYRKNSIYLLRDKLYVRRFYIFPHGRTFQTQSQLSLTAHGGRDVS